MKKTLLTISLIVSSCFFVSSQVSPPAGSVTFTPITGFIAMLQQLLDRAVPLLISLAVLGLFWFLLQFIWKGANNPEERKKAREGAMWSIFAIFLMVGVWGIITLISVTLRIQLGGEMQDFKIPGTQ